MIDIQKGAVWKIFMAKIVINLQMLSFIIMDKRCWCFIVKFYSKIYHEDSLIM